MARAESEPSVADSPQARLRLDAEVPNVNEAIRTALATGDDPVAADLVVAWGRYWYDCGRRSDGLPWAEAVLQRELDPDRRARVLLTRGPLLDVRNLDRF